MYTLDRFARNRYDSAIYKAKLKRNGVKIFYAKQPMPDTPEGIILESVLEDMRSITARILPGVSSEV